jgi:hypothetical protein
VSLVSKATVGCLFVVLAAATVVVWLLSASPGHAEGYTPSDTLAAIDDASARSGVPYARIYGIVGCETGWTFNPYTEGDYGTSHGAAQLHEFYDRLGRPAGEFGRFLAAGHGYDEMYDPYVAMNWLADAINAGRARAWTCA